MEINLTFHVIAHANGMKTRSGDILDAYLPADAKEVLIKCRPEFGESEGTLRIMSHALYGLLCSGHQHIQVHSRQHAHARLHRQHH